MNKITLGVLFGGVSSEHDISTVSAKGILSAIDKETRSLVESLLKAQEEEEK